MRAMVCKMQMEKNNLIRLNKLESERTEDLQEELHKVRPKTAKVLEEYKVFEQRTLKIT